MIKRLCSSLGLAAALAVAATATAQPINLGFESADPGDPSMPQGWDNFNFVQWRVLGDALTPAAVARTGTHSMSLPNMGDFSGYSTNWPLDSSDPLSPRNNASYLFGIEQAPVTVTAYFYIPSSDPLVGQSLTVPQPFAGHRAGIKLEFRRTVNDSVFQAAEWLDIDPNRANVATLFPGIVVVSTPNGPGIHTNNQWLKFERTVDQNSGLFINSATGMYYDLPPQNPNAKVSILPLRFGPPPALAVTQGTVFFDDISFRQGSACPADINGVGGITVQDIFDFLAFWFANAPQGDFNQANGVTVQDIFDFLAAWFAGCP